MSVSTQLFLLAIVALVLGPALYRLFARRGWIVALLDAFVLVAIIGLLGFHVLPSAFSALGAWSLVLIGAGWALPGLVERSERMTHQRVHKITLVVAVGALAAHTLLDGVALAGANGSAGGIELALAVVLHRIPVGMFVWSVPRPVLGTRAGIWLIVLIIVTTAVGFGLGTQYLPFLEDAWFVAFQALVTGSLLHVVLGHGPAGYQHQRAKRIAEAAGTVLALVLLWGLAHLEHAPHAAHAAEHGTGFLDRFFGLLVESAPALLLGYLLAGALGTSLPRASARWMGRGSRLSQAGRGVLFGAPLPICSCGVVPVYHSLVQARVPATAAMAFLVATPEIGVEALLISVPLLGMELTIARLVAALLLALVVGWVVGGRVAARAGEAEERPEPERPKLGLYERARASVRLGLGEVVDETAAWILAGIVVAAALDPSALSGFVGAVPDWAEVAIFAVVGIPLYVCASGATPLAAALLFGGVSPGAAIAFLLAGPATNLTTFGLLTRLHGRHVALLFGGAVIALATGLGLAINLALPDFARPVLDLHEHGYPVFNLICVAVLMVAFLGSLYREGPRGWILTVARPGSYSHDHGGHDHGHDHGGHDHGGHDHDHGGHDHDGHDHDGHEKAPDPCCSGRHCC